MITVARKLTEEIIEKVDKYLTKGLPMTTVCDLLCITQPTFSNWNKKGEADINDGNDTTLFAQLFITIKNARAKFEDLANDKITSGEPGWQGMAWWLERTRPQYMPKQEISAGEDGKVQVILGGKLKDIKKGSLTESGEIK